MSATVWISIFLQAWEYLTRDTSLQSLWWFALERNRRLSSLQRWNSRKSATLSEAFWIRPSLDCFDSDNFASLSEAFWIGPSLDCFDSDNSASLSEAFWIRPSLDCFGSDNFAFCAWILVMICTATFIVSTEWTVCLVFSWRPLKLSWSILSLEKASNRCCSFDSQHACSLVSQDTRIASHLLSMASEISHSPDRLIVEVDDLTNNEGMRGIWCTKVKIDARCF